MKFLVFMTASKDCFKRFSKNLLQVFYVMGSFLSRDGAVRAGGDHLAQVLGDTVAGAENAGYLARHPVVDFHIAELV